MSTTDILIKIIELVFQVLDKNGQSLAAILDITKAFTAYDMLAFFKAYGLS